MYPLKMWIFAVTLLFANGIFGQEFCERPHFITCKYPFSPIFPGTTDELNRLCPLAVNYYKCVKDYEKTCAEGTFFRNANGSYESITSLTEDICNNGTLIHTVVFENIDCIKTWLASNPHPECNIDSRQVGNAFLEYKNTTQSPEDQDAGLEYMKEMCLFFMYNTGCLIKSASTNCGPLVKEVGIDATNRSYFLRSQCTIEALNELQGIANSLNITDSQKDILNESLRTLSWN